MRGKRGFRRTAWAAGCGAALAVIAGVVAVAASLGLAPPGSAVPSRTWKGWEYATMIADPSTDVPVVVINGQQFRGYNDISRHLDLLREAQDLSELLEGLGGRGWELAAFDRSARGKDDPVIQQTWIFKRPR